jgi:hypothetical protein
MIHKLLAALLRYDDENFLRKERVLVISVGNSSCQLIDSKSHILMFELIFDFEWWLKDSDFIDSPDHYNHVKCLERESRKVYKH